MSAVPAAESAFSPLGHRGVLLRLPWISPRIEPSFGPRSIAAKVSRAGWPGIRLFIVLLADAAREEILITLAVANKIVLALKRRADRYHPHAPVPEDVLLLVEVSDTTLRDDQGEKRDLYAKHGISEYWVVDVVPGERLFVYSQPAGGVHGQTRTFNRGDTIAPAALPGAQLAVSDLFA